MELIKSNTIRTLSNPGVTSRQILNPDNSESRRITITEVHLEPGASQPRHRHETSEQIWYALSGHGKLLLSDGQEQTFDAGDAVRFADGDIHGLKNPGPEPFHLSFRHFPADPFWICVSAEINAEMIQKSRSSHLKLRDFLSVFSHRQIL